MVSAIIVAAGRGTRFGPERDKLFLEVAGRPVIAHTWARFAAARCIDDLIVVVRDGMQSTFEALAREFGFRKHYRFAIGGPERQDSVWNGLQALSAAAEIVVIQDAARPCTDEELIAATVKAARETGAAVAASPIVDTIKESNDGGLTAARTLDRTKLWAVQTPQTFRVDLIRDALATVRERKLHVTDDTAACELIGHPVRLDQQSAAESQGDGADRPANDRTAYTAELGVSEGSTSPCTCNPRGFGLQYARNMWRSACLTLCLALVTATKSFAAGESAQITLDYVAKRAEERAKKPFRSPRANLPAILSQDHLDYDKYREIEFRHENALWAREGLPFRIEFFHPGYIYHEPVKVNEFTLTHVQPIRFLKEFFDYRSLTIGSQIPVDTGYAGFRLLHPLNYPDKWDELGSFLGASYFRLLGKGQRYGQSARGLALDCGESDRPEEFPIFTDWWLGKPHRDDSQLRFYAILDSVSCAGAYEFLIQPGETTVADMEAILFFREEANVRAVDAQRKPMKTIGIAPLTSMFWFGKNSERKFDDYRPEVHDSDGLLLQTDSETLWRPLNNASVLRHQVFATKNLRGFGLFQREQNAAAYEDIFNPYHLVPSVWVQPRGRWTEGEVHLVELSTHYEGLDNIVAFWRPAEKPAPLQPFRVAYTLHWTRETDMKLSPNRVVATRIGADGQNKRWREIMIDFDGPKLDAIPESEPPAAVASCSGNGAITFTQVYRNAYLGRWRVILKLEPKPDNQDPIDIRCTLKKGDEAVSETWTYHWSPL